MGRQNVRLILCGVLVLGMAAPAAAVTDNSSTLPLKMRGKDWCESSSASSFPNGKFTNFNLRNTYSLTITPDPSGNGNLTGQLQKDPNSSADASLTEFELHGRGLFRNKSNRQVEFVLTGDHQTVPGIFLTLRGKASIDKNTGAIKRVEGTFVYERDDNDQNNDPAVHCFGSGTFGMKKHDDHNHPEDNPHPEDTVPHS